jgi:hypothetical protein
VALRLRQHRRAAPRRDRANAGYRTESRITAHRCGVARCFGAVGPLRDPEADHRWPACRRLRPPGEDRVIGAVARPHRPRRHRGSLARPGAALHAAVRLDRGTRAAPRSRRRARVSSAHARSSARRQRRPIARSGDTPRRVEVGRHPRAARRHAGGQAHLFAWRRRHFRRLPRNRRGDCSSTRCSTASFWSCAKARWRHFPTSSSA